jgi:uncharacterized damage-inducible protein DinB
MSAFAALADVLRQLEEAVGPLTDEEFTCRAFGSSGSIGAHVRHCLDHAWALERGIAIGQVCYDHRERDTVLERERSLARSRLRRAAARLGGIDDALLVRPLTLVVQTRPDGPSMRVATTVGRELAFVVSHTVHHSALVAVLLEHARRNVPERFGLAATTPVRSRPRPTAGIVCAQ